MSSNEAVGVAGLPLPTSLFATVEELRANRTLRRSIEVRELELSAHFADQNGWVDQSDRALPGTERLMRLGGDGTPEVAEFCTLELAGALGIRDVEASSLVADALDLRHRLPCLWALVLDGRLEAWTGRRLASITRDLDAHGARLVDLQLARCAVGMSRRRLESTAEGLVLAHLDADEAEARREAASSARGVWISQDPNGIADVSAVLDAPDGAALEATVTQISRILATGGMGGGENARRAAALGVLATPARALQLQQASLLDELPIEEPADPVQGARSGCALAGQSGHVCGTVDERINPDDLLPRTSVVLHLTDTTLVDGSGPVRPETLQPLLAEWLRDLFGTHRVTVRPVIDANRQAASDAYECPPTMREAVELRNPCDVFPFSTRRSRGCDLDHTLAWHRSRPVDLVAEPVEATNRCGGGPTHPSNLGPLNRKAHRAKTHGGWQLHQPISGVFLWQSPLGYRYLVTPSRTLALGRSDAPRAMMAA